MQTGSTDCYRERLGTSAGIHAHLLQPPDCASGPGHDVDSLCPPYSPCDRAGLDTPQYTQEVLRLAETVQRLAETLIEEGTALWVLPHTPPIAVAGLAVQNLI